MPSLGLDCRMELDICMLFSSGNYVSSTKSFIFLPPFPTLGDGSVSAKGLAHSHASYSSLISLIYANRSSETMVP